MNQQDYELETDLEYLFSRKEVREFIKLVVCKGETVYKAERKVGLANNTGARQLAKFFKHQAYLEKRNKYRQLTLPET